jgi:aerobic C4-dicarboxylate transport protein
MTSRRHRLPDEHHPTTIVGAFADGDILQVLFFAVLFGIALAWSATPAARAQFPAGLTTPIFKLVSILMKAAPIGAFGAMAFTIGKYGIGAVINLAMLVGTFYLTSLLFVFVVLGAVARYNGFSIWQADPLHQGRAAAGAGHLLVGSRAAQR